MRYIRWSVAAAVMMSLVMVAVTAGAEVRLKAENSAGDQEVRIPVSVSSAEGAAGLQFKLHFDPSLLSAADGKVVSPGKLTRGWSLQSNHGEGWVTAVMFNPSLKPLERGNGTVAYVRLRVSGAAAPGKRSLLRITDVVVADSKGNAMPSVSADAIFIKKTSPKPSTEAPKDAKDLK
jgi:hypothetical protein